MCSCGTCLTFKTLFQVSFHTLLSDLYEILESVRSDSYLTLSIFCPNSKMRRNMSNLTRIIKISNGEGFFQYPLEYSFVFICTLPLATHPSSDRSNTPSSLLSPALKISSISSSVRDTGNWDSTRRSSSASGISNG